MRDWRSDDGRVEAVMREHFGVAAARGHVGQAERPDTRARAPVRASAARDHHALTERRRSDCRA